MHTDWKKNTALFLASQTLSFFGSALVQYAMTWYITLKTQSGTMMTLSILCGFLPTFFLSPFAGVWADRFSRKRLIMLSDGMIALVTLVLAFLFSAGYERMWLLFTAAAVRSLGGAVQTPAVGAFLPQLVPTERLTRVNGINGSLQAMVLLLSPMLSGALLSFTGIQVIFFIDAVTAAAAILTLLLFLRVPAENRKAERKPSGYFGDLKEGFRYIAGHSYLKPFFAFCAVFMVLAGPLAFLTPLQVTRTFGGDVWRLTAVELAFSAGMTGGGVLMASWGGLRNRVHTMTLASLLIGACAVALGTVPNFWVYLAFMAAAGLSMPAFNTPSTVLLQEKVEPDFLGRVFGVMSMISSVMMPAGMLLFGPLADSVRIEWMLVGTGALIFTEGFFLLGVKPLVRAGEPVRAPGPAGPETPS